MSESHGVLDVIRHQAPYALRCAATRIEAATEAGPVLLDLQELRKDVRDWTEGLEDGSEPTLRLVAPPAEWMTDPPPPRRWLIRHPDRDGKPCGPGEGDGLLARGITGILAGEGGSSKTQVLLQLAVSLVTGRPWFGRFVVDSAIRWSSARVLLALGEEDKDEVHRRLHAIAQALDLNEGERAGVSGRIRIAPLAGKSVGLLAADAGGSARRSAIGDELAEILAAEGGADGWALVGLDPIARWAGLEIEADNHLATRWIEVLEDLAKNAPGRPAMLAAAHSSKLARRANAVDARGVTALTDGARWFGTLLRTDNGILEFTQMKSNYSRPWAAPVPVNRGNGGVLTALDADDADARAQSAADDRACARDEARARQAEADLATVLDALAAAGNETTGKVPLTALAQERGLSRDRARAAIEVAHVRGLIVIEGKTSATRLRRATEVSSEPLVRTSADLCGSSADSGASCAAGGAYEVEAPPAQEAELFSSASAAPRPAEAPGSVDGVDAPTEEGAGEVEE